MRIKIVLEHPGENQAVFPLYYNHELQSFIYRHISPELADFLHKEGYPLGKRKFKLFTFSRLLGKFRINSQGEKIIFSGSISFYLSSPKEKFIQQFAETLLRSPQVTLSRNSFIISNIEVFPQPHIQDDVTIRMLSPVTIYSTLFLPTVKRKLTTIPLLKRNFSG